MEYTRSTHEFPVRAKVLAFFSIKELLVLFASCKVTGPVVLSLLPCPFPRDRGRLRIARVAFQMLA